jgi:hypothetical protein
MKTLDKLISLLLLIVLTPAALIITILMISAWDSMPAITGAAGEYTRQAIDLAFLCARLVLALAAGAGLVWVGRFAAKAWHNYNQQRDGSHRLRTYKVRDAATGEQVEILVNPDLMMAPALAIGSRGVRELGSYDPALYASHAAARAKVAEWQAKTPGDDAIITSNGSTYRTGGLGGSAKPMLERPTRPALPAPLVIGSEPPATPVPDEPLQLGDALRQSNPDQFVLGHNPDAGKLAIWQPREHLNLGVFGVSGTGKTKSTGYQTMLLAARHGYHVVCLDPKAGVDFGPFASHVEWQPTDAYIFGDQMAALYAVHAARHRLMQERGVGEWRMMPASAGPEIVVVLEEFGAIREEIAASKAGAVKLAAVDHKLEMMFRLARMTGFHFVVLDQAPEKLPAIVRGGCKLRLAYQLDTSQASLLKEYEADTLPAVGAFMHRRVAYQSWNCDTHLPQLLQRLPPFGHVRLLPAPTERPSPEGANDRTPPNATERQGENTPTPPLPEPPFDVRSAPKRDLVFWWRSQRPQGAQADFREWAAQNNRDIARGYVSDMFKAWDDAKALADGGAVSLEQLRAQGLPISIHGANGTYAWEDKA